MENNLLSFKTKLGKMLSRERFDHSILVMETARELARRFGVDEEKAALSGLLHDCAKELSNEKLIFLSRKYGWDIDSVEEAHGQLLHAPASAQLAKEEFGISDNEILSSIAFHTVGRPAMSQLEKIIYLADHIEPQRDYPRVEAVRKLAQTNLEEAIVECIDSMLTFLIQYGKPICFKTLQTRNYYLLGKN